MGRFDGKFNQVSKQEIFLGLLNTFMYLLYRATHSPLTTHHSPLIPDQLPGKFPGLHSGFLMQNTWLLISESKLQRRLARKVENVTVFPGSCDGVRGKLGCLVDSPRIFHFFPMKVAVL